MGLDIEEHQTLTTIAAATERLGKGDYTTKLGKEPTTGNPAITIAYKGDTTFEDPALSALKQAMDALEWIGGHEYFPHSDHYTVLPDRLHVADSDGFNSREGKRRDVKTIEFLDRGDYQNKKNWRLLNHYLKGAEKFADVAGEWQKATKDLLTNLHLQFNTKEISRITVELPRSATAIPDRLEEEIERLKDRLKYAGAPESSIHVELQAGEGFHQPTVNLSVDKTGMVGLGGGPMRGGHIFEARLA